MRAVHLIGTSFLALAAVHPAHAQDVTPQVATTEDDAGDEIIVTAAGRAQIAQDVPIALSVVGGEALANAGVTDIRGIRQLAPSLQSTTGQSSAATVLRIRGIGTAGDTPGFEASVGVFVDGVYRARAGTALADLPPLDRVEVLRGPQGTLFGRNVSAGALSIFTQKPEFQLGGYVEGSYGNYDEIDAKAGITGPVSDKIALRVDGGYHKRDGYIRDANSSRAINNIDRYFVRGQALFENEAVKFRLIGDYAETDEQCCGALNTNSGFLGVQNPNPAIAAQFGPAFVASSVVQGLSAAAGRIGIVTPFNGDARTQAITPGRDYGEKVKEWGVSGQLDWALGNDLNLTSITAYRDWKVRRNMDIDFSGLDRAYRDGYKNGLKDFTQEVRLQGQAFDGHLDWLVGGFYLNEKLTLTDTVRFGAQADAYVDNFINGLTDPFVPGPTGFQVFGTRPGTPLVGQVLLQNPTLLAAASAGGPTVLATFLNPFPATPNGAGQVADQYGVNTDAIAVFTHNIIKFNDVLSLTLGLRYNHETKKIDANLNSVVPACGFLQSPQAAVLRAGLAGLPSGLGAAITNLACNPTVNTEFNGVYSGKRTENELTGTAKLAFKLSNRILLFGGYDRGYKAGGYNLDRGTFDSRFLINQTTGVLGNGAQIDDLGFAPETVDSFEVGIKTEITRAFTFNASVFYADFKNFQDLTFVGNSFRVTSVAKARSKGVEVESIIRPARNITVNLGYSYVEAEYLDASLRTIPEFLGYDGAQITNQPRNVVTAAITWVPQLREGVGALFHVDSRFNSKSNTSNDPFSVPYTANQDYVIVNARAGLNFLDKKLSIEAYVENLFNTYYNVTSFPVPEQSRSYGVYPGTPRFYGIKARFEF